MSDKSVELSAHVSRGEGAWLLTVVDIEGEMDEFNFAFGSLNKAKQYARVEFGVGRFERISDSLYRAAKYEES